MLKESFIYVSVVVPVYKIPEKLLRQSLESLRAQTMIECEFIIVDDDSPDRSGQICDEYASLDGRFTVIHQSNTGLSEARNNGVRRASGEYVMFLDGDDYIEPDTCQITYDAAKKSNSDVVFWNIQTEYNHGSKVSISYEGPSRSLSTNEVAKLKNTVLDFNGRIAQVFAKLIRRSLIVDKSVFHRAELKQGAEGIVFCYELFSQVSSVYYLNLVLNHYVYNKNSISHSPNTENYYLIVNCFEYIEKQTQKQTDGYLVKQLINIRMLYVIMTTAITGFFNPMSQEKYTSRKHGLVEFLKNPTVNEALRNGDRKSLSKQRRIILKLIDFRLFPALFAIGILRYIQYQKY